MVEKIGYKKVITLGFTLAITALIILVTCNSYISLLIGLLYIQHNDYHSCGV